VSIFPNTAELRRRSIAISDAQFRLDSVISSFKPAYLVDAEKKETTTGSPNLSERNLPDKEKEKPKDKETKEKEKPKEKEKEDGQKKGKGSKNQENGSKGKKKKAKSKS